MKLLFDQNLSFKLCRLLADAFSESNQIRLIGLEEAADRAVWEYARTNGFILPRRVRGRRSGSVLGNLLG
jgi:predicted nuclease of predicted toxin-antitoxin system